MIYQVLDTGRPADSFHTSVKGKLWANSLFNSLVDAEQYVIEWLGGYGAPHILKECLNNPVDYSGYGDTIEIREVREDF